MLQSKALHLFSNFILNVESKVEVLRAKARQSTKSQLGNHVRFAFLRPWARPLPRLGPGLALGHLKSSDRFQAFANPPLRVCNINSPALCCFLFFICLEYFNLAIYICTKRIHNFEVITTLQNKGAQLWFVCYVAFGRRISKRKSTSGTRTPKHTQ